MLASRLDGGDPPLPSAMSRQATAVKRPQPLRAGNLMVEKDNINELTGEVIGSAIEVHKTLGPGMLESTYEECLCRELLLRNIPFDRQKALPIHYKGVDLDCGYRLDIVVENRVIIELKACDELKPIHKAQLLTYLKLTGIKIVLLLNFNVPVLKEGIKRLIF